MSARAKLSRAASERGFIGVAVLWILAALALLVAVQMVSTTRSAATIAISEDGLQTEAVARGAIEMAVAQLLAVRPEDRPMRGAVTLRMPAARADVGWLAETARIDLNLAPPELLQGLFRSLGAGAPEAAGYADRIVAWRSAAQSGVDDEDNLYRAAGLGHLPRHAPFQHVAEVWLVHAIPAALIARATPLLTVFSGRAAVDPALAPPLVLSAMPDITPDVLQTILQSRARPGGDGRSAVALPDGVQSRMSADSSRTIRLSVAITFANRRSAAIEAVVLLLENGDEPYRLLSWRDGAEGAM